MRILFMGTPDFAVASLRRLVEDGHEICGVFTQPDRPKNRGHKLMFSPVKQYAVEQGLTVYQPLKMKDGTALATVRELNPELIVVAAYGRILPEDILNTPKYGSINVHSSLLPRYRGAAPINWAILDGEKETGVSIMYMAPELDAGDVIRAAKTAIDPEEDAQALTARLAELGAQALAETVEDIARGTAARTPQDHTQSTYAPMLTREMQRGRLDAPRPADPRSGARADPVAVCRVRAGRTDAQAVFHARRRRDGEGTGLRHRRGQAGHRGRLWRRTRPADSRAAGAGRPPHGRGGLSAGS